MTIFLTQQLLLRTLATWRGVLARVQAIIINAAGHAFLHRGGLTIHNLKSVCIFSILFSIHFLRSFQGEFVSQLRASLVGDHFLHSPDLYV